MVTLRKIILFHLMLAAQFTIEFVLTIGTSPTFFAHLRADQFINQKSKKKVIDAALVCIISGYYFTVAESLLFRYYYLFINC